MNTKLINTIKRQRATAAVEPVHANLQPVLNYINYIKDRGVLARAMTIPKGTAAFGMGYRFVSIPIDEVDYYIANGATIAAADSEGA